MELADSIWPRGGGDRGNRSQTATSGPREGRIIRRVRLEGVISPFRGAHRRPAGGAVAADGSLRVAFRGMLYKLSADGDIAWARNLRAFAINPEGSGPDYIPESPMPEDDADGKEHELAHHSLPCVLGSGETFITMQNTAAIVGSSGELVAHIEVPLVDDTGCAPNVDRRGVPILTAINGPVYLWQRGSLESVGRFGYDIVPPAVFDDNSLAVSGYAGSGFCRVRHDGTLLWRGTLDEASYLPTVSRSQLSAVGSLNQAWSAFHSSEGELLGIYLRASVFAEYLDGGWVALSEGMVAHLSPSGSVQWEQAVDAEPRHGNYQPIVDARGTIYVPDGNAIVGLDAGGRRALRIEIGDRPGPLFPAGPGVLGTVAGDELLLIS